jgi:hypothetical protein
MNFFFLHFGHKHLGYVVYNHFYLEVCTSVQQKPVWNCNMFRSIGILTQVGCTVFLNPFGLNFYL